MKKTLFVLAALLAVFMTSGCKSAPEGVSDPTMPPWINDMPPEGFLWGVGVAANADQQMRLTMAETRARQDLARQIQVLAQGMVTDYARDAGGIDSTSALQFQESVTRQITQANLQGASRQNTWTTRDNKTLWVRVQVSKDDAALNSIQKAIDSEAARYAEFKAMEALKMMDSQIEKSPPFSVPVIE